MATLKWILVGAAAIAFSVIITGGLFAIAMLPAVQRFAGYR